LKTIRYALKKEKEMMKKFIAPLLALLVSGCQIDPYTHAPTLPAPTGMMLVWKMRYRATP